jgi:hypothetical protein
MTGSDRSNKDEQPQRPRTRAEEAAAWLRQQAANAPKPHLDEIVALLRQDSARYPKPNLAEIISWLHQDSTRYDEAAQRDPQSPAAAVGEEAPR